MKYKVQLELNIETEHDMERLTSIMHRVVKGLGPERDRRVAPPQPDFPSAEIKQLTVKRLVEEPEGEA